MSNNLNVINKNQYSSKLSTQQSLLATQTTTNKYVKNKNISPPSTPPKGIFGKRNVTTTTPPAPQRSPPLLVPLQRLPTTTKLLNNTNSCCNEIHKLGTIPKYLLKHKKLQLDNNKNYIEYEQKLNSENDSGSGDTKMIQEVIEFCEFSKKWLTSITSINITTNFKEHIKNTIDNFQDNILAMKENEKRFNIFNFMEKIFTIFDLSNTNNFIKEIVDVVVNDTKPSPSLSSDETTIKFKKNQQHLEIVKLENKEIHSLTNILKEKENIINDLNNKFLNLKSNGVVSNNVEMETNLQTKIKEQNYELNKLRKQLLFKKKSLTNNNWNNNNNNNISSGMVDNNNDRQDEIDTISCATKNECNLKELNSQNFVNNFFKLLDENFYLNNKYMNIITHKISTLENNNHKLIEKLQILNNKLSKNAIQYTASAPETEHFETFEHLTNRYYFEFERRRKRQTTIIVKKY